MSGLLGLGAYGSDSENEDEDKSSISTSQASKRDGPSLLMAYSMSDDESSLSRQNSLQGKLPASVENGRGPVEGADLGTGEGVKGKEGEEGGEGEGREEAVEVVEEGEAIDTTYFDQLPPEVEEECDPEEQEKITKFLRSYGNTGFTPYLKSKKDFGNPELLSKIINMIGIDEYGSNYPVELFNPHGYTPGDYIDSVQINQRRLAQQGLARPPVPVVPQAQPPPMAAAAAAKGLIDPVAAATAAAQAIAAGLGLSGGGAVMAGGRRGSKWGPPSAQPTTTAVLPIGGGGGGGVVPQPSAGGGLPPMLPRKREIDLEADIANAVKRAKQRQQE